MGTRLCAAETLAFHCWARIDPLFLRFVGRHHLVKGGQQELGAVDALEVDSILCEALAWPVNIVCRKIER